MAFWNKKPIGDKKNVYRVTYRARGGDQALISEMIIKSRREEKEINFAGVIAGYWEKKKEPIKFEAVTMIENLGVEE